MVKKNTEKKTHTKQCPQFHTFKEIQINYFKVNKSNHLNTTKHKFRRTYFFSVKFILITE